MNDRLQRRLRDADPLTATGGSTPDPTRLDAIREHIMETNDVGPRSAVRPRTLAGVGVAAIALAGVLVAASLVRPSATTLAWSAAPTPVSDTQKDAATTACTAGLATIGDPKGPAGGVAVLNGNGPVSGTSDGGAAQVASGAGLIPAPSIPTELPPLVSLELHGTGGIAIFTDDTTTAYCLLLTQGDGFRMGGLLMPSLNGSTIGVAGVGAPGGPGVGAGTAMGSVSVSADNGLQVTAMAMSFEGSNLGIIAGVAPEGATSVAVHGGPADGGTATVTKGMFALWAPSALGSAAVDVIALDAAGNEMARQTLFGAPPPGAPGVVTNSSGPSTP